MENEGGKSEEIKNRRPRERIQKRKENERTRTNCPRGPLIQDLI